jgi:glc operon protein GlcG
MKVADTLAILLVCGMTSAGQAQTIDKKVMSLDAAKKIISAAVAEAREKNAPGGAIAVVDEGGNLVAVERLDNTFAAGASISIGKARTAALFKRPTKAFEDIINKGRTAMATLPDFTPLQGGVPVIVDGRIIGAIGVSGAASAQQDEELASAGANALATNMAAPDEEQGAISRSGPGNVTYFPAAQVTKAFEMGMPLSEIANYKIHASHRDGPGIAEVHSRETDIIYMLEGDAVLVTGGSVIDGKKIAAEEIRGKEISGGESRRIGKGDVIVVPHGTPHWFKEVSGPINYYVVKVRSAD